VLAGLGGIVIFIEVRHKPNAPPPEREQKQFNPYQQS
jgi:hypothetical protein